MTWVSFDIETIPSQEQMARLLQNPPEFEAPKNYKDPQKIQAHLDDKKKKWEDGLIKKCSVTPHLGMIASASFTPYTGKSEVTSLGDVLGRFEPLSEYGQEELLLAERELVKWIWTWIVEFDRLVVWNGINFDVPWTDRRSIFHLLKPSRQLSTPRYRYNPVCDVKQYWCDWDQSRVKSPGESMEEISAGLGITTGGGKELGMHGSMVYPYLEEGRWEEVKAYNLDDTVRLAAIYERISSWSCLMERPVQKKGE